MTNTISFNGADPAKRGATRAGFWVSISLAVTAALSLGIAVTTLPHSGPFCAGPACIVYPYTDAAAYVPADYNWMYPSILMIVFFMMLVICIHVSAPTEKQVFAQFASSFAIVAATALLSDYFIQLFVMQPSILLGEREGLSLFSQYNPHGVFIALENMGYLMMSMVFLFCAPSFSGRTKIERALRWLFVSGFVLTAGALVIMLLLYGMNIDYRFEVVAILINWLVLIVSGILLAVFFRRANHSA